MNAPAPTDVAALREALEITLEKALSPYQARSRWVRGGYASNLAVDAALRLMLPILAEREAALARATTTDADLARALDRIAGLEAERLKLDRRINNQRRALRENWEITEMRNRDHHRGAVRSRMLALAIQHSNRARRLEDALRATAETCDELAQTAIGVGDNSGAGALQFVSGYIADRFAALTSGEAS